MIYYFIVIALESGCICFCRGSEIFAEEEIEEDKTYDICF